MCRIWDASRALPTQVCQRAVDVGKGGWLARTRASFTHDMNTRRCYHHVIGNGEAAFAVHPLAVLAVETDAVEGGGLAGPDACKDGAGNKRVFGMEILEGGRVLDLVL